MHLMPTGICVCDVQGNVIFYNRRVPELLRFEPKVGQPWAAFTAGFKIFAPNGTPVSNETTPLMLAVREGRAFRDVELEIVRPDGSQFTASANIDPIRDPTGKLNGAIMVFLDVTARKRSERNAALLAQISQEVAMLADESAMIETATRLVGSHLGTQACSFVELDAFRQECAIRQGWTREGQTYAAHEPWRVEAFGSAELVRLLATSPVAIDDVAKHTLTQPFVRAYTELGVQSFMTAPAATEDRSTVLFAVAERTARRWQPDELQLLESAAARVWPLIERARASRALRETEEASRRLAALVESSDDAIIGVTLSAIITSWNQGAVRMFGYTANEVLGRSVTILIPPDRHNEEPAILAKISRGEHTDHYETIRRRKDGTDVYVSLSVSPVKNREGRIVGASKIARDVTARRRAEGRQRALYDMLASVNRAAALPEIYEVSLDAILRCLGADRASILLHDSEHVMRFVASRGLSGEYRAAVEGHSPWANDARDAKPVCVDDVAAIELEPALRAAIAREGIRALAFVPLTYEHRLIGKFMVYYNAPHRFAPDEVQLVEAIATQVAFAIERRKGAQALEVLVNERTDSLRQAIAQMEEFSYSVSHDLRAPVRAMRGYAEAVLQDYGERLEPEGRELLERIQRNGARMDRLIQDLLTYSRLSRREIRLEPVSLRKLVPEVLQQYPQMHPENADIQVCGTLPDVLAHEPSLTQVLSNLLSNAVKFVPPKTRPRVRISSELRGQTARLWIEDNGIGIKPEYQHRLFGMFERIHPEQSYEGTGIGLAIVRKAIERMNGKVGMQSDGRQGSRFWIELATPEQALPAS